MEDPLIASIIIGLVAGFLGGQFGVGGGLITTPAIRLILNEPALIAVGTPLPIIIPTAISGFYNYRKENFVDYKSGLLIGATGALFSIAGAYFTRMVGGQIILIITAVLIALISLQYLNPNVGRARRARPGHSTRRVRPPASAYDADRHWRAGKTRPTFAFDYFLIGIVAGFLSGFLGLGGGFIIIPALTILLNKNIKEAFGTSLLAIILIAIPGSVAHFLFNNVNLTIAALITIGVIPGAYLGSKTTIALPSRIVSILFGFYLLINAILLAFNEIFY